MNRILLTKKDFGWTCWTTRDIARVAKEVVAEKKARYAEIKKLQPEDYSFETVVRPLEFSDYNIEDKMGPIHILAEMSPKKNVREAAHKAEEYVQKEMLALEYDEGIFKVVEGYKNKKKKLKEKLTPEEDLLFRDMWRDYARMGFTLPPVQRKKLIHIIEKLQKLSIQFSKNINDYEDYILVTKKELEGLSERYIKGLSKKGGKYKVTLAYPDSGPFMQKAKSGHKRKELHRKILRKGGQENIKLIKRILALRGELASILGYKTYADYAIETRMAKTAQTAHTFINNLLKKTTKKAKQERKELEKFKQKQEGNKKPLASHDIAYWTDQYIQAHFDLDSEYVREHFPFVHVRDVVLETYQKLFGITFERVKGFPLWHEDVELFCIKEKGKVVSYFFLDLFPRKGKYGHAMATTIREGRVDPKTGKYIAPFGGLVTNFPKPTKSHPSLLSHGEVETFFHEFGHVMHIVLTKAHYMSQSGAAVAWDFIEAPSQMLEHWAWDTKMIQKLSAHYKTGKPLPKKDIEKLQSLKHFHEASWVGRQCVFSLYDLVLHMQKVSGPVGLFADFNKKYLGIDLPKDQKWLAGFGHIVGGYDAGYYSYMWAQVYAADLFTKFQENGLIDTKTGRAYRTWILEKGGSMEEEEMVKKFLGRKANDKAFLKDIGVEK